jgi:2-polyprenyl-3-methyl-5-hydroxy-6-metoxy-1,4-benzoquinol methylase
MGGKEAGEAGVTADFDARRKAARARLDAIDPHMRSDGVAADPFRRDWFNAVYDTAGDDAAAVPWASLAPHSGLVEWLAHYGPLKGRAIDIGCGLGDNAEALAEAGAEVSAFDVSAAAIGWAKRRFPRSMVDYRAADLFGLPAEWLGAFDLVHECQTLQALPEALAAGAARALASLVAPGGRLLVIARARGEDEPCAGPPWPLARSQMAALAVNGLQLVSLDEVRASGAPRYWRGVYRRD